MTSAQSSFSVFPPPAPTLKMSAPIPHNRKPSLPKSSFFAPPAPVPKISLPNPHNRKPSLSRSIMKSDSVRESVIITIEDPPVPPIPGRHLPTSNLRQTPSPDGGRTLVNSSPESRVRHKDIDRTTTSRTAGPGSHHSSPEPESIASSHTLDGGMSTAEGRKSPVVPIRSMFPVYNPNLPLSEQHYYPQRPAVAYVPSIPVSKFSRSDMRTQVNTPIDRELSARPGPPSEAGIPMEVLSSPETNFSTPRSLDRLWEATHGTEPNGTIGTFDLEMARTSDATFAFGPKPDLPFYSVTTYDTNEIAITKICPRKRTVTCDVALSAIEAVERRLPPNDGLVTFIFPKMAAMLAINQSAALAEQHSLAPTHRDEVQAAAMKRAADQEASYLRYNRTCRRYELDHPAIARKTRDPNFIASPSSPEGQVQPTLHIVVHSTVGRTSHGKPSITVTFPVQNAESAGVGMRLSTVGQSEIDCTLASLDFHSKALHIDANKILRLMPSLFAIDSVFTAMLAVAIADPATNAVMGSMDIWLPPPRGLTSPSGSAMSWGHGSTFYATLADREEAEAEAKAMREMHKKDVKSHQKARNKGTKSTKTWYGKERVPKQKGKKQIVIAEFDLEKLTHYQSGAREGQELPGVTTAILSVLIGGLKFVVWVLTAIVQVIAWILVRATRCVTSEKF